MSRFCFVRNCNSLQQTFCAPTFFLQEWKNALQGKGDRPFNENVDKVCANHFDQKFIFEEPVYVLGGSGNIKSNRIKLSLKPGAIPFQFDNVEVKKEKESTSTENYPDSDGGSSSGVGSNREHDKLVLSSGHINLKEVDEACKKIKSPFKSFLSETETDVEENSQGKIKAEPISPYRQSQPEKNNNQLIEPVDNTTKTRCQELGNQTKVNYSLPNSTTADSKSQVKNVARKKPGRPIQSSTPQVMRARRSSLITPNDRNNDSERNCSEASSPNKSYSDASSSASKPPTLHKEVDSTHVVKRLFENTNTNRHWNKSMTPPPLLEKQVDKDVASGKGKVNPIPKVPQRRHSKLANLNVGSTNTNINDIVPKSLNRSTTNSGNRNRNVKQLDNNSTVSKTRNGTNQISLNSRPRRCRASEKDQLQDAFVRRPVRPRITSIPTEDQIKKKKMVAKIVKSYEKKKQAKFMKTPIQISPLKPRGVRRGRNTMGNQNSSTEKNEPSSRKRKLNSSVSEPPRKKGKQISNSAIVEKEKSASASVSSIHVNVNPTSKTLNNSPLISPGDVKRRCFVLSCLHRCQKLFRAPSDVNMFTKWLQWIPRRERAFTAKDWICADHFGPNFVKKTVVTSKGTLFTLPVLRWTLTSDQAIPTFFRSPKVSVRPLVIKSINSISSQSDSSKISQMQDVENPTTNHLKANPIIIENQVARKRGNRRSSLIPKKPTEIIKERVNEVFTCGDSDDDPILVNISSSSVTPTCIVPGCFGTESNSSANSNITFHNFPTVSNFRNLWVREISRKTGVNILSTDEFLNKSKVCELHFLPVDYVSSSRNRLLKKTAVPSKFKFIGEKDDEINENLSVINKVISPSKTSNARNCSRNFNLNENSSDSSDLEITFEKMVPASNNDRKSRKVGAYKKKNGVPTKPILNQTIPIDMLVKIKTEKVSENSARVPPKKSIAISKTANLTPTAMTSTKIGVTTITPTTAKNNNTTTGSSTTTTPPPTVTTIVNTKTGATTTVAALNTAAGTSFFDKNNAAIGSENQISNETFTSNLAESENPVVNSPTLVSTFDQQKPSTTGLSSPEMRKYVILREKGKNGKMQVYPYNDRTASLYKITRNVVVPPMGKFSTPFTKGEVILASSEAKKIIFSDNTATEHVHFITEPEKVQVVVDTSRQTVSSKPIHNISQLSNKLINDLAINNNNNIHGTKDVSNNSGQRKALTLNDKTNAQESIDTVKQIGEVSQLLSNPIPIIPENTKQLPRTGSVAANAKGNDKNKKNDSSPRPKSKSTVPDKVLDPKTKKKGAGVVQQTEEQQKTGATDLAPSAIEAPYPEKLVVDRKKKIPVLDQVFSWKSFLKLPPNDAWSIKLLNGKIGQYHERFIFISELVVRDGNLVLQRVLKIKEDLSYNVLVNGADFTNMFDEDSDRISSYARLQEITDDLAAFNVCMGLAGFSCVQQGQAEAVGQKIGDFWFSHNCDILCVDMNTCSSCLSLIEKLINIRNKHKAKPLQSTTGNKNSNNQQTKNTHQNQQQQQQQHNQQQQHQQHHQQQQINIPPPPPLSNHPPSGLPQPVTIASSAKIACSPTVSVTFNQMAPNMVPSNAPINSVIGNNDSSAPSPVPPTNIGMLTNFVINQKPVNASNPNPNISSIQTSGGGVIVIPKARQALPAKTKTTTVVTHENTKNNTTSHNNKNNKSSISNNPNQRPPAPPTPVQSPSPHHHPQYTNKYNDTPINIPRPLSKPYHHDGLSAAAAFPSPSPSSSSSSSSAGTYNYGNENDNNISGQSQMSQGGGGHNYPSSIATSNLPRSDFMTFDSVPSHNNTNTSVSQSPIHHTNQLILESNQLIANPPPISVSSHSSHHQQQQQQQQSNIYYYQPIHFQNIYGNASPVNQSHNSPQVPVPATNYFEVYTPSNNLPISSNNTGTTMTIATGPVMQYQQPPPQQQISQHETQNNPYIPDYTNSSLVHHFPTFPVPPIFPYPNHFAPNQQ